MYDYLDVTSAPLFRDGTILLPFYQCAPDIHEAAVVGDTHRVTMLLGHGADVNARDEDGLRPVHLAARGGHTATCALLLDHGADVNAQAEYGLTPLGLASWNGHIEIAALLRQRGGVE